MTRVYLDANVMIAAAVSSSGESRAIIRKARGRANITVLTTRYAWEEAETHLQQDKQHALAQFYALREDIEVHPEPSVSLLAQVESLLPRKKRLPKKDWPILAGAISAGADLLLTHDREHFSHLYGTKVRGVEILKPMTGLQRVDPRP